MLHQRFRNGNARDGYHFSRSDFETSNVVRAGNLVFSQGRTGITQDGEYLVGQGAAQGERRRKLAASLQPSGTVTNAVRKFSGEFTGPTEPFVDRRIAENGETTPSDGRGLCAGLAEKVLEKAIAG